MRDKTLVTFTFIAGAFLTCLWFGPSPSPGAQGTAVSREAENPLALEVRVTGTVVAKGGGYYIRGRKPNQVFRITNPMPEVLDAVVKTGRPVQVEARVVQGDNVAIERIDGRAYLRPEAGER